MRNEIKIDGKLTAAPLPSDERLEQLAHGEYRTVIDLRTEDEIPDRHVDPMIESRVERGNHGVVERLGMNFVNIPVPKDRVKVRQFEAFREQLGRHNTPAYIYSQNGTRAAIFALLIKVIESQMKPETALDKARELGIRFDTPQEEEFFKNYVAECVPKLGG